MWSDRQLKILLVGLQETLYIITISSVWVAVLGLMLGLLLYVTQRGGLSPLPWFHRLLAEVINMGRAIPFVILLILLLPLTRVLMGTILGKTAALPALIVSASPFFARMVFMALNEVPTGVLEATKSMGAAPLRLLRIVLSEALVPLVGAFTVTVITLVGFIAASAVIGTGGLGFVAYVYGFQRNDPVVMYSATIMMIALVFIIQLIGDFLTKKLDHR